MELLEDKNLQRLQDSFMRIGLRSLSMVDIARLLGTSKKTLYECVSSKEDLLECVLEYFFRNEHQFAEESRLQSRSAIDQMIMIRDHVLGLIQHLSPTLIYDMEKFYPRSWHSFLERRSNFVMEIIRTNLEEGIQEGLYRGDINTEAISNLYSYMAASIIDRLDDNDPMDKKALFSEFIKYHLYGISTPRGQELIRTYDV